MILLGCNENIKSRKDQDNESETSGRILEVVLNQDPAVK